MKRYKTILLIPFLLLFSLSNLAQNTFEPPSSGKTVIYFMRTTSLGALMNFRFFDGENYLGKFKDKNYFRYECEPGTHLFWVKAENLDFLEAELLEDKIYMVEANSVMGAFSSGVKFNLIDYDDEKQMKRVFKLLNKKEPLIFDQDKVLSDQNEMQDIIKNGLEKYNSKQDRDKEFKKLLPEMFYVIE
jgi:hypothetical protein